MSDGIINWFQINRFAANKQSSTELELASVALMLITLPNSVAAIELGTAAAAAVVRPLFFFEFFFAAILIPTRSLSKLIFDHGASFARELIRTA